MKQQFPPSASQGALADYLFPINLEHILPIDETEAPPLSDVEYIGLGDTVMYEFVNDWEIVERRFTGLVIGVCYNTNRVLIDAPTEGVYWCSVNLVSLVTAATQGVEAPYAA